MRAHPFPHPRLHWVPALAACALAAACGGGDPSQESLVGAGSIGAASSRDHHVAALANAVGSLEAKVTAMEARAAITTAAAVGTYRLLSAGSKAGSSAAGLTFASSSSGGNGTVTLAPNGSFTYSNVQRMSGYTARISVCNQLTDFTSSALAQSQAHNHAYSRTNCGALAYVSTHRPTRETETGGGTWRVGPGNTLLLTPSDGPVVTVYLVQGGGVGFSLEIEDQTDGDVPGTRLAMSVFVKQ